MVASQSSSAPLVVVFGSTGAQGGSVVDHLIASNKEYRIKGVTRDPTKSSGQNLKSKGVEAIKADLKNVDEISSAIKGADVVFAVTNFWESGAEGELEQGRNLIKAIKAADPAPLYIFSGLPSSDKVSRGKFAKVEHFDNKALLYEEAKQAGIKVLSVEPAGYMENFTTLLAPRKQDDGSFVLGTPIHPEGIFALINARRDYGAFVVSALEAGQTSGRVLAGTEDVSAAEIAKDIAQASGKDVKYQYIPLDVFAGMAGEETAQMFSYFDEFGYYGGEPLSDVAKGKTQTWKEFVQAQDWSKTLV